MEVESDSDRTVSLSSLKKLFPDFVNTLIEDYENGKLKKVTPEFTAEVLRNFFHYHPREEEEEKYSQDIDIELEGVIESKENGPDNEFSYDGHSAVPGIEQRDTKRSRGNSSF